MKAIILSAEESKKLDTIAIEKYGLTESELVELAGRTCAQLIVDKKLVIKPNNILVLVGSGNNGADGLVIARHLLGLGCSVKVALVNESKSNLLNAKLCSLFLTLGGTQVELDQVVRDKFINFDIIIDSITGIGFKGLVREEDKSLIELLNNLRKNGKLKVISIDLPSFNSADACEELCGLSADYTIAIQGLKYIHIDANYTDIVGMVSLVDIGMPVDVNFENTTLIQKSKAVEIAKNIFTEKENIHKGNRPKVLIIGGGEGKEGAAMLSALGALNSGASLVTIASTSELARNLEIPEIMFCKLGERKNLENIQKLISNSSSIVLGPGLGLCDVAVSIVKDTLDAAKMLNKKLVIDADAISILGKMKNFRDLLPENLTVLTPHPKEFLSLTDFAEKPSSFSQRLDSAKRVSKELSQIILLKGARTIVSSKSNSFVSPYATPLLAVGGSGDVLSGIVSSLISRSDDLQEATSLAVILHAYSANFIFNKSSLKFGILPSHIAGKLGQAIQHLLSDHSNLSFELEPFNEY